MHILYSRSLNSAYKTGRTGRSVWNIISVEFVHEWDSLDDTVPKNSITYKVHLSEWHFDVYGTLNLITLLCIRDTVDSIKSVLLVESFLQFCAGHSPFQGCLSFSSRGTITSFLLGHLWYLPPFYVYQSALLNLYYGHPSRESPLSDECMNSVGIFDLHIKSTSEK